MLQYSSACTWRVFVFFVFLTIRGCPQISIFLEKIFVRLGGGGGEGLGPVRLVFVEKYQTLSMDGHCANTDVVCYTK